MDFTEIREKFEKWFYLTGGNANAKEIADFFIERFKKEIEKAWEETPNQSGEDAAFHFKKRLLTNLDQ